MTAPAPPAPVTPHTSDRYAARTHAGAKRVGHLLHRDLHTNGRDRLALCGVTARVTSWRHADTFSTLVPACPACTVAAGITTPTPRRLLAQPAPHTSTSSGVYRSPSAQAHVVDPQRAGAALPDEWAPRHRFSVPMLDEQGQPSYGLIDPGADDYVLAAQHLRHQQHHAHTGGIRFPDWVPLTRCTATP